eukprot:342382-Prorocentrum_lima.AAC.1
MEHCWGGCSWIYATGAVAMMWTWSKRKTLQCNSSTAPNFPPSANFIETPVRNISKDKISMVLAPVCIGMDIHGSAFN